MGRKTAVSRVFGWKNVFNWTGYKLMKKGGQIAGLSTLAAALALGGDALKRSISGTGFPIDRFATATMPFWISGSLFGTGALFYYGTSISGNMSRLTAEANSIGRTSDVKSSGDELENLAGGFWDEVIRYESELIHDEGSVNESKARFEAGKQLLYEEIDNFDPRIFDLYGNNNFSREEQINAFMRGIGKVYPMSDGIEATREEFINSLVWALINSGNQDEERGETGVGHSQIEAYLKTELWDNILPKLYRSNAALRSAKDQVGGYFLRDLKTLPKGIFGKTLGTFTQNKFYAMAGKGFVEINEGLNLADRFTAQPTVWTNEIVNQRLAKVGVREKADKFRDDLYFKIFDKGVLANRHIYGIYGNDLVRSEDLKMRLNPHYSAGLESVQPLDRIIQSYKDTGRRLNEKKIQKVKDLYRRTAVKSLDFSEQKGNGCSKLEKRALAVAHYVDGNKVQDSKYINSVMDNVSGCTEKIIQSGTYAFLANHQIRQHQKLVHNRGQQ